MKICPECGNPSYEGASVCGNCGHKFPKPKTTVPKREDIFKQDPEEPEISIHDEEDSVDVLKENKLVIGAIAIIILIIICGVVLIDFNNNTNNQIDLNPEVHSNDNLLLYNDSNISFEYPESWKKINRSDEEHPGAIFFQNENNVTIEYYNISSSYKSLVDVTQARISFAQQRGDYVQLVETITINKRNTSNILLENTDGNYTRYVATYSDSTLYVFKISGSAEKLLNTGDIQNTINSTHIK